MPSTSPGGDPRPPGEEPAVEITGLVKRYGTKTAVDGLDLTVARGTVTAVLGPNGAGKTTTVETCEGYRRPDAGRVRVLGLDPVADAAALRPRIGVMLQSGGVYAGARAEEMLRHTATLHAHPLDVGTLIDRLGLGSCGRTPTGGSRAASNNGWRWRWPWSAAPSWSSWTSRRPDSTRRPGTPPGTSYGNCAPTASAPY